MRFRVLTVNMIPLMIVAEGATNCDTSPQTDKEVRSCHSNQLNSR
jgi:hypothetical protein